MGIEKWQTQVIADCNVPAATADAAAAATASHFAAASADDEDEFA